MLEIERLKKHMIVGKEDERCFNQKNCIRHLKAFISDTGVNVRDSHISCSGCMKAIQVGRRAVFDVGTNAAVFLFRLDCSVFGVDNNDEQPC